VSGPEGTPNGVDRLAQINSRSAIHLEDGIYVRMSISEREALVEIAKQARDIHDFLENEKETHEPPRELLNQGYVALERSADYEKDEELNTALGAALARLDRPSSDGTADSGAAEENT
jgi:hypothetical protein